MSNLTDIVSGFAGDRIATSSFSDEEYVKRHPMTVLGYSYTITESGASLILEDSNVSAYSAEISDDGKSYYTGSSTLRNCVEEVTHKVVNPNAWGINDAVTERLNVFLNSLKLVRTMYIKCTLPVYNDSIIPEGIDITQVVFQTECDFSKVESMNYMFKGSKVIDVIMSDIVAPKLRSAEGMFADCKNLVNPPNVSTWDTPNLECIKRMFENSGVTHMVGFPRAHRILFTDDMYRGSCITSINMEWYNPYLKTASRMFAECQSLIDVSIKWDTPSLVDMKDMFCSCKELLHVIALNVKAPKLEDMYGLFRRCSKLQEIRSFELDSDSLKNYDDLFFLTPPLCISLEKWSPTLKIVPAKFSCDWRSSVKLQDGTVVEGDCLKQLNLLKHSFM